MPAGITPSDRKILLIGGALLFVMLAATVLLAPSEEQLSSPVPSTYSGQPAGAEAAYVLLSQLHYPVRRWEASPVELDADPDETLLILADPFQLPADNEKNALKNFVEDGGHVLFTGANIRAYFPDASPETDFLPPWPIERPANWQTFSPSIPNRLSHGAQHVTFDWPGYWGELKPSQLELYGDVEGAAVVSWQLGRGEILWWGGSTPLTNAGIAKDDNLTFFLNALRNWRGNQPYSIYWDEYFHGQRNSLWSYVGKTSLAWGVLQFGVLAAAVLFTFSRRSGPTFVPSGGSRLSPLEFVDTLGGLYERAGATGPAVSVSYQRLRSLLLRQLSLASNIPDNELGQAADQRLGWKDAGTTDLLDRAASASRDTKLEPNEALELVQKLEERASRLATRRATPKEKI
jgi:Domain of unknown function (DUF4350)